jgi:hypothetical protein
MAHGSSSETTVSYTVKVRPKGPVPVAALEWRIREDVPTNLRAVMKAAVGMEGVFAKRNGGRIGFDVDIGVCRFNLRLQE